MDLVPSKLLLFKMMKDSLHRKHFPSKDTVKAAVKLWVTSTGVDFCKCCTQALVHHWQKRTAKGGDSVEKKYFVAENSLYQTVLLWSLYQL